MNTNGTDKAIITCPQCNQRFSVKPPVPEEPMNALKFTTMVALHEKPIHCQNAKCGASFIFVANAIQVTWGILMITKEQADSMTESKIILPELRLH